MSARQSRLSRLWAHEKASYGLRVFIALTAAVAACWQLDALTALPGVFLGIIASAIAETDDNWWGRTKAVLLSLLCFCIAAASVIWLFPWPWVFIGALALSTFGLTLLGALGERYASIAQATVTLAIYTMIGLEQHGASDLHSALDAVSHLLAGAVWYGLLSILWTALFANRPVRERVARLYQELGRYLQLKAALFEPVREADLQRRQLDLAEQNRRVVGALNEAKTAILARFGRSGRPCVNSGLYLRLYYMAQDFHERASSSHYPYGALVAAFFHSDVLYRCQRLLDLQGQACARLGEAIRLRRPFVYGENNQQAGRDLADALAYLRDQQRPQWQRLLGSLDLLVHNLRSIERRLLDAERSEASLDNVDTRLPAHARLGAVPPWPAHGTGTDRRLRGDPPVQCAERFMGAADHRVRVPAQLRRHPPTPGPAHRRHARRAGTDLGTAAAVPAVARAAADRIVVGTAVLLHPHRPLPGGVGSHHGDGTDLLQPDRRWLRADRAAHGRHRAGLCDRSGGGVPDPARLAGPPAAPGAGARAGHRRTLPGLGAGPVPQRHARRPGLPHRPPRHAQRRRGAVHRAVEHAA
ncbi:hypothetical protein G6F57_013561 [Rhizopus arrhizus]|nr:hypothetical protein G6F57_013561 [Rhizopus arrhizus]